LIEVVEATLQSKSNICSNYLSTGVFLQGDSFRLFFFCFVAASTTGYAGKLKQLAELLQEVTTLSTREASKVLLNPIHRA